MQQYPRAEQALHVVLDLAVGAQGKRALKQLHLPYRQGNHYDQTFVKLREFLWLSLQQETSWPRKLDDFAGTHAVPIMTIHKSKGLEYHTIIFVGLEDAAFWSFANQAREDTCAFFVAFSRAQRRVLLTFSAIRTTGPNHQNRPQAVTGIKPLYDILAAAGVPMHRINQWPSPQEPVLAGVTMPSRG